MALPGIGPKLIVHGLVVHDTVGQRDEDRLQQPVAPRQGPGREAGLLVVQQRRAGMDELTCAPARRVEAAISTWGSLRRRLVFHALS